MFIDIERSNDSHNQCLRNHTVGYRSLESMTKSCVSVPALFIQVSLKQGFDAASDFLTECRGSNCNECSERFISGLFTLTNPDGTSFKI